MTELTERDKVIMHEAFMIGRIYVHMGEKESPHEINDKLEQSCKGALNRFELRKESDELNIPNQSTNKEKNE